MTGADELVVEAEAEVNVPIMLLVDQLSEVEEDDETVVSVGEHKP